MTQMAKASHGILISTGVQVKKKKQNLFKQTRILWVFEAS